MSEYFLLALRCFMATSLYAFLGWALYSIWHFLRISSSAAQPGQIPALTLTPSEMDSVSRVFTVPEVIIGRDPHCEYPIPDETISAHHARLSFHHNQWWLEDLRSTNGTLLNGEKVDIPTIIVSGDEVCLGTIHLQMMIE